MRLPAICVEIKLKNIFVTIILLKEHPIPNGISITIYPRMFISASYFYEVIQSMDIGVCFVRWKFFSFREVFSGPRVTD